MTPPIHGNPNVLPNSPNQAQARLDALTTNARAFAADKFKKEWGSFYKKVKDVTSTSSHRATLLWQFSDFVHTSGRLNQILSTISHQTNLHLSTADENEVLRVMREETFKLWIPLLKQKEDFIQFLDTHYVLNKKDREKIAEELEKKSESEIEKLRKSALWDGLDLAKFFKKSLKKIIPAPLDFEKFISQLWKKIEDLTYSQKKVLYGLYDIHQRDIVLWDDDIDTLFIWPGALFPTTNSRKKFLKYFFPTITLKQLQDFWILTDRQLVKTIETSLWEEAKKFWIPKRELFGHIDLGKVSISTTNLDITEEGLKVLIEGPVLEEFVTQLKQYIKIEPSIMMKEKKFP